MRSRLFHSFAMLQAQQRSISDTVLRVKDILLAPSFNMWGSSLDAWISQIHDLLVKSLLTFDELSEGIKVVGDLNATNFSLICGEIQNTRRTVEDTLSNVEKVRLRVSLTKPTIALESTSLSAQVNKGLTHL
jgi:hypothetical protein